MVIKTELCAFSETRIYPGHGSRFVRKDGQVSATTAACVCVCVLHEPRAATNVCLSVGDPRSRQAKDGRDVAARREAYAWAGIMLDAWPPRLSCNRSGDRLPLSCAALGR